MTEISLRTKNELIKRGEKAITWKPLGSVISAHKDITIRMKWLEIVCDLVSPQKRNNYKGIPGYQYLCDHWTPELRKQWIDAGRPTEEEPHGFIRLSKQCQKIWDEKVDPSLISTLGKDPTLIKNITDTWLWSEHERKTSFIITNTDIEDYAWDVFGQGKTYVKEGHVIVAPGAIINYATDIGLSQTTLDKIADPNIIVHPRFDLPVAGIYFNSPNLDNISVK